MAVRPGSAGTATAGRPESASGSLLPCEGCPAASETSAQALEDGNGLLKWSAL